jgi:prepilin-type processing-associated H-X9-DG protein
MRRVQGGEFKPLKGAKMHLEIYDPRGEALFQKVLTTSEFGTINGEFELKGDAPLGEYSISSGIFPNAQEINDSSYDDGAYNQGGNRFRVEEYKRPEYKVQVFAPEKPARPGTLINARINAQYYFGGAVPNAKVKYTIRKSVWESSYRFPRPFDWLWKFWNEGDYSTGRRNIGGEGSGEIVKQGEAKTDAQGNAEVSFTAVGFSSEDIEMYGDFWNLSYTIEAEITDASRRTVEAQGEVKVARQEYFAFLDSKHGFYQIGDRVPIEIATMDANDNRVAAKGKMVVYKLLPVAGGKEKEEQVFQESVATEKGAPTFWNWQAKGAGSFRIAYEATDGWGQKIRASIVVWIAGKELDTTQFRLQGVTLVLEKRVYQEGDVAKVLVVADKPDATILLTQEAGGEILRRDLLKLDGKSRQIEIPITKKHVPNFALAAAAVRDYEVFATQQEIFVPPARQMLNVEVKSDKQEYKPGETGTFEIKTTDWQGKPARAEISLALLDASLFYIQKNYAPDIRTFYYGERRAVSTALDSSRSGRGEGRLEDKVKYTRFESRGWTLPDGMGQLEISPGNVGYYLPSQEYSRYSVGGSMRMNGANYAFADGSARWRSAPRATLASPAAPASVGVAGVMESESNRGVRSNTFNAAGNAMTDVVSSEAGSTLAEARIRENFAETAFWSPAVVTENGSAKVKVTFPDSLTSWHADARGLSTQAQVGAGESEVETKKDVIVRMQAPRFFVERDQVVLSANVHNYLSKTKRFKVSLQTSGALKVATVPTSTDAASGASMDSLGGFVNVKAGEETRVDWTVDVVKDGTAEITMTAQSNQDADAVKMSFPVLVHGVQKFSAQSGVLRDAVSGVPSPNPSREGRRTVSQTIKINLPAARQRGASTLNVQVNPSLAATMLDALPYLADYPYGCVEQTMSRFVPTVVAQKTLRESGVDLNDLRKRAKAYEAEAKAKPIGERVKNSGYTYPTGMPNSRDLQEMASQLWYSGRSSNPIYNTDKMARMTREGLARLAAMQKPDGGWGWWQESKTSDPYMSAVVVAGLITAEQAGERVNSSMISRGLSYLDKQMADEDAEPLLCQIGYTLAMRGHVSARAKKILAGRLWQRRAKLNPYSQSLLALALWNMKEYDKARVLVRNLENTAQVDQQNQTARWKENANWWYWWNNDVETCAWALRAFVKIDPQNKLTPMIAKWLTVQARSNHWRSTKETANVVYALADCVRVFKELDVDYTLVVRLDNKIERTYRVTRENALWFDNRFIVNDFLLTDGENVLTIEKRGKGTVYWSASAEYFSREEPIKGGGNEIAIKRRYFKLTRFGDAATKGQSDAGKAAAKRGDLLQQEYSRLELRDGDTLKSGDLVEVELTIDSSNDYSYLVFEDMKPAGLEPVDIRSGYAWGDGLSSNVELRDEKVALFVDRLPQGTRVLRYRMRAEIPGKFHALPTNGYAMYAPEVRAISDEVRINVRD